LSVSVAQKADKLGHRLAVPCAGQQTFHYETFARHIDFLNNQLKNNNNLRMSFHYETDADLIQCFNYYN